MSAPEHPVYAEEKRKALERIMLHLQIARLHLREARLDNHALELGLEIPSDQSILDLQSECHRLARPQS
jgi:hypothetical protein